MKLKSEFGVKESAGFILGYAQVYTVEMCTTTYALRVRIRLYSNIPCACQHLCHSVELKVSHEHCRALLIHCSLADPCKRSRLELVVHGPVAYKQRWHGLLGFRWPIITGPSARRCYLAIHAPCAHPRCQAGLSEYYGTCRGNRLPSLPPLSPRGSAARLFVASPRRAACASCASVEDKWRSQWRGISQKAQ